MQEVRDLLAAWGPDGRRIYLYLAVVDTLIFPFCYASLVAGVLHFLATQLEGESAIRARHCPGRECVSQAR